MSKKRIYPDRVLSNAEKQKRWRERKKWDEIALMNEIRWLEEELYDTRMKIDRMLNVLNYRIIRRNDEKK